MTQRGHNFSDSLLIKTFSYLTFSALNTIHYKKLQGKAFFQIGDNFLITLDSLHVQLLFCVFDDVGSYRFVCERKHERTIHEDFFHETAMIKDEFL